MASWTVSSEIVAAVVNGKIRVTFPSEIIDTTSLRSSSKYSITSPTGAPALSVLGASYVNPTTIDVAFSGKMQAGSYSLALAAGAIRYDSDGTPNAAESLAFNGVVEHYSYSRSDLSSDALSVLGEGLSFPLRTGPDGEFARSTGEDNIDECLVQLLRTEQGERPFAVRDGILFGTKLRHVLFESGPIAQELAYQTVNEAIITWEPRIRLLELQVRQVAGAAGGAVILLGLKYLILGTNNVRNLVLPFQQ